MSDMLTRISVLCLVVLMLIALLRKWRQPDLVAYILAGVVLGPGMLGFFRPDDGTAALGDIGILLLMFFLGLEIDIPDTHTQLRRPIIAQMAKLLLAAISAWLTGFFLRWEWHASLLLAILLTFNSTAVVSEYMRRTGELDSETGRMVLSMLLLQDILVAPVFAFFQWAGRSSVEWGTLAGSALAATAVFLLLRGVRNRNIWSWRGWRILEGDHELQVFVGALCCIGCGWLSAAIGLSAPIGSFAAGLWLGRAKEFHWLGEALKPFKVFFVALYFLSVGLIMDLTYIRAHWMAICFVTAAVLIMNSLLSALVFRTLGLRWMDSWRAGALLSQTGELGLLACSVAAASGIITGDQHKLCVAVTGLSLLLSTAWTSLLRLWPSFHDPVKTNSDQV